MSVFNVDPGQGERRSVIDKTLHPRVSRNSLDSARVVVPLLYLYVEPQAVVDLGCKHGEWLSVFAEAGARRVLGFDLEKRRPFLVVKPDEFRTADLAHPLEISDRFDLAVCLESAEHLPPCAAEPLVRSLTRAAPVVLFSAAPPGQGGQNHVNEQPRRYWRGLFASHGFKYLDCLRPHIWQDARVAWWYRQNVALFANDEGLVRWPALREEALRPVADDLDLVHTSNRCTRRLVRDVLRDSLQWLARE